MKAEEPDDDDDVFEDASEVAQGESMESVRKAVRVAPNTAFDARLTMHLCFTPHTGNG
jgi:hypothetical protein